MKTKLILALMLLLGSFMSYGSITINVASPVAYQQVDSTVRIQVAVTSTYEITTVMAVAGTNSSTLTYNIQQGYFEGTLSTSGLQDTVNVEVKATDAFQTQQSSFVKIIIKKIIVPWVVMQLPLTESVARPGLRIKAKILDPDSCEVRIHFRIPNYERDIVKVLFIGNVKDSLDMFVSLDSVGIPPADVMLGYPPTYVSLGGTGGNIIVYATNKKGEFSSGTVKNIYVEHSPFLQEVYAADKQILDFSDNKLLLAPDSGDLVNHPAITDILTGQTVQIPYTRPKKLASYYQLDTPDIGKLTSVGAVFGNSQYGMFDWHNGVLDSLPGRPNNNYKMAGDYVSWEQSGISLKNVATQFTSVIGQSGSMGYSLTSGGIVTVGGRNVERYDNGIHTTLTNNTGNFWYYFPATDGVSTTYLKANIDSSWFYLNDGQSEQRISNNLAKLGTNTPYSLITGGWSVFYNLGPSGVPQLTRRDSAGNKIQITYSGLSPNLSALGDNGDILYVSRESGKANKTLLYTKDNRNISILQGNYKTYYKNGWYFSIGRMLYKLDTSLLAHSFKLKSFTAEKKSPSENVLKWTADGIALVTNFQVERSTDSINFSAISVLETGVWYKDSILSYTDNLTAGGDFYYRLKILKSDNTVEYSQIRAVKNVPFKIIGISTTAVAGKNVVTVAFEGGNFVTRVFFRASEDSLDFDRLFYGANVNVITGQPTSMTVKDSLFSDNLTVFYQVSFELADGTYRYSDIVSVIRPYIIQQFDAAPIGSMNQLSWIMFYIATLDRIEIERSIDSTTFFKIGSLNAYRTNSGWSNFVFTDSIPLPYINYYRLKLIRKNGMIEYSEIKSVINAVFSVSNFTAAKNVDVNQLVFAVDGNILIDHLEVERSSDSSSSYVSINTPNKTDSIGTSTYSYTDANPLSGANFYRIKFVLKDGSIAYSPVRRVDNTPAIAVSVYPNPVQGQAELNISLPDLNGGTAQVVLANSFGNVVRQQTTSSSLITFNISGLPAGTYYIKVTTSTSSQSTTVLIL